MKFFIPGKKIFSFLNVFHTKKMVLLRTDNWKVLSGTKNGSSKAFPTSCNVWTFHSRTECMSKQDWSVGWMTRAYKRFLNASKCFYLLSNSNGRCLFLQVRGIWLYMVLLRLKFWWWMVKVRWRTRSHSRWRSGLCSCEWTKMNHSRWIQSFNNVNEILDASQ